MSRGDRARGALFGLAIGDALGMPTQSLPRDLIIARYGDLVADFHTAPEDHPLAAGLRAGSITDDTEQALVVAQLLIEGGGHIVPQELARRLLAWESGMKARGSLDLLGPSTRRALDDLLAGGEIDEVGRYGTTNGAAMRITPVGIVGPSGNDESLLNLVVEASVVTHNTAPAISGAAAVAAAVSTGIDGGSVDEAIKAALVIAPLGMRRGSWVAGADIGDRIAWAVDLLADRPPDEVIDLSYRLIGTSLATQESVATAFGIIAASPNDPWLACRIAASVGGDTDTIAAMVGAVLGACHGVSGFPDSAIRIVQEVNHIDLAAVADRLLRLRPPPEVRPDAAAEPAVVHLGNVLADVVVNIDQLPAQGDDVVASNGAVLVGGGFNVMAACARQGVPVRYAGLLGDGAFGRMAQTALRNENIEIMQSARRGIDTGFCIGIIDAQAERTFVTNPGVETTMSVGDLRNGRPTPGDAVYLSGYSLSHPATLAAIADVLPRLHGDVTVVFDPGPLVSGLPPDALRLVMDRADWITCNARESKALTGHEDPARGAAALVSSRRNAIVRVGAQGCWLARVDSGASTGPLAEGATHVRGFTVRAVDTNGAGDAHTGVFMAGIIGKLSPEVAVLRATAAAAIAVTRHGPATAPTGRELDSFLVSKGWHESASRLLPKTKSSSTL